MPLDATHPVFEQIGAVRRSCRRDFAKFSELEQQLKAEELNAAAINRALDGFARFNRLDLRSALLSRENRSLLPNDLAVPLLDAAESDFNDALSILCQVHSRYSSRSLADSLAVEPDHVYEPAYVLAALDYDDCRRLLALQCRGATEPRQRFIADCADLILATAYRVGNRTRLTAFEAASDQESFVRRMLAPPYYATLPYSPFLSQLLDLIAYPQMGAVLRRVLETSGFGNLARAVSLKEYVGDTVNFDIRTDAAEFLFKLTRNPEFRRLAEEKLFAFQFLAAHCVALYLRGSCLEEAKQYLIAARNFGLDVLLAAGTDKRLPHEELVPEFPPALVDEGLGILASNTHKPLAPGVVRLISARPAALAAYYDRVREMYYARERETPDSGTELVNAFAAVSGEAVIPIALDRLNDQSQAPFAFSILRALREHEETWRNDPKFAASSPGALYLLSCGQGDRIQDGPAFEKLCDEVVLVAADPSSIDVLDIAAQYPNLRALARSTFERIVTTNPKAIKPETVASAEHLPELLGTMRGPNAVELMLVLLGTAKGDALARVTAAAAAQGEALIARITADAAGAQMVSPPILEFCRGRGDEIFGALNERLIGDLSGAEVQLLCLCRSDTAFQGILEYCAAYARAEGVVRLTQFLSEKLTKRAAEAGVDSLAQIIEYGDDRAAINAVKIVVKFALKRFARISAALEQRQGRSRGSALGTAINKALK